MFSHKKFHKLHDLSIRQADHVAGTLSTVGLRGQVVLVEKENECLWCYESNVPEAVAVVPVEPGIDEVPETLVLVPARIALLPEASPEVADVAPEDDAQLAVLGSVTPEL